MSVLQLTQTNQAQCFYTNILLVNKSSPSELHNFTNLPNHSSQTSKYLNFTHLFFTQAFPQTQVLRCIILQKVTFSDNRTLASTGTGGQTGMYLLARWHTRNNSMKQNNFLISYGGDCYCPIFLADITSRWIHSEAGSRNSILNNSGKISIWNDKNKPEFIFSKNIMFEWYCLNIA